MICGGPAKASHKITFNPLSPIFALKTIKCFVSRSRLYFDVLKKNSASIFLMEVLAGKKKKSLTKCWMLIFGRRVVDGRSCSWWNSVELLKTMVMLTPNLIYAIWKMLKLANPVELRHLQLDMNLEKGGKVSVVVNSNVTRTLVINRNIINIETSWFNSF